MLGKKLSSRGQFNCLPCLFQWTRSRSCNQGIQGTRIFFEVYRIIFSVSFMDLHITLTHPSGVLGTYLNVYLPRKFRFCGMSLLIHLPGASNMSGKRPRHALERGRGCLFKFLSGFIWTVSIKKHNIVQRMYDLALNSAFT